MSALKEVFLSRILDRLYSKLKSGPLNDWDAPDVWKFSKVIIKNNTNKIDEYLRNNEVTLKNINQAIDEIVNEILLPSVKIE